MTDDGVCSVADMLRRMDITGTTAQPLLAASTLRRPRAERRLDLDQCVLRLELEHGEQHRSSRCAEGQPPCAPPCVYIVCFVPSLRFTLSSLIPGGIPC